MRIDAIILMEPVGKARARTVRTRLGKSITYTPGETVHAENSIRDQIMGLGLKFPSGTPIHLEAIFYRSRPKSRKKDDLPVTRPDIDNYTKLLTDALEKFCYDNDSQITTLEVKKRYAANWDPPRIHLIMEEDNSEYL